MKTYVHDMDVREEGRMQTLLGLIIKKHLKGKSLTQIAEELEIDADEIEGYYNAVVDNSTLSEDEIYELLIKQY